MPTAYLQTMRASVATTRCCSGEGDPQVNKFEHISKVGHQMSVAGGRVRGPRSDGWGVSGRSLKSDVGGGGVLYSEVQGITGNGHMGTPYEQTE